MSNVINLTNIKNVINDSYYPLLSDKNRYLVLKGGAGSGKSVFLAQKILLRILNGMSKGVKHRILVLRKTIPAAKKSVFPLFKHLISEWNLSDMCKLNKTEMSFTFSNGSEVLIGGLDDPEKIKSIFDITSIWLEESFEFTIDDFRQLDLRMRGKFGDYYQMMLSFNPISKNTWVYKEFFEAEKGGATLHHSNYKDNRFLDEEYKLRLEELINEDKNYYRVYGEGKWGSLEGLIYENWSTISSLPSGSHIYGCDFGFTNSETAVVDIVKRDKEIFVEEKLYKLKMTNSDLIKWCLANLDEGVYVYCDAADPDRIEELKRAGIRAKPARKGKGSVLNGIDFVKRHRIYVVEGSNNLIKEISGYRWKTSADRTVDEPVKWMDHALDALRYGAWTQWGRKETELKVLWI